MRDLVAKYAETPVLISGRDSCLSVAQGYGFTRAVSMNQLSSALGPSATPFSAAPSAPDQSCPIAQGWGSVGDPFGAVLCMTDPSDWARDLQLCCDVVMSHGVPGRTPFAAGSPVEVRHIQHTL
jgi:hypothetical protein